MILAALVLGGLGLYYFGLRVGMWAAIATLVLCVIALVAPALARPIHIAIAVAAVALWQIGSRRPRPPDAVLAVRFVRGSIAQAWKKIRGGDNDR